MLRLVNPYNMLWFEYNSIFGHRNTQLKNPQLILGVPIIKATWYVVYIFSDALMKIRFLLSSEFIKHII